MPKRTLSAKALAADIRAGMSDEGLMEKYSLTPPQLESLFLRLVQQRVVSQEAIDNRRSTPIARTLVDLPDEDHTEREKGTIESFLNYHKVALVWGVAGICLLVMVGTGLWWMWGEARATVDQRVFGPMKKCVGVTCKRLETGLTLIQHYAMRNEFVKVLGELEGSLDGKQPFLVKTLTQAAHALTAAEKAWRDKDDEERQERWQEFLRLANDASKIMVEPESANAIMELRKTEREKAADAARREAANKLEQEARSNKRLLEAATRGDYAAAQRAIESGATVNCRNDMGRTSLMVAASNGNMAIVKLLLSNGANVTLEDADGEDAATLAQQWGHMEVAKHLQQILQIKEDINTQFSNDNAQ